MMYANFADSSSLNGLSRRVIGCAFTVINAVGGGFGEKLYENGLALELEAQGLGVERQRPWEVRFRDAVIGTFVSDLVIEGVLLVELKSVAALNDAHRAQCINYLRASGLRLCLLLNFGNQRLEIKRIANGA